MSSYQHVPHYQQPESQGVRFSPSESARYEMQRYALLHDAPFLQRLLDLVIRAYLRRRQDNAANCGRDDATIKRAHAACERRRSCEDGFVRAVAPDCRKRVSHAPIWAAVGIVCLQPHLEVRGVSERVCRRRRKARRTFDEVRRIRERTTDGRRDSRGRDFQREAVARKPAFRGVKDSVKSGARVG